MWTSVEKSIQLDIIRNLSIENFNIYLERFAIIKTHTKLDTLEKIKLEIKSCVSSINNQSEYINVYSYLTTFLMTCIKKYIMDRNILIEEIKRILKGLILVLIEEGSNTNNCVNNISILSSYINEFYIPYRDSILYFKNKSYLFLKK